MILQSAQRTRVASNAIGLLMTYALNLPSDTIFPGAGLRRVQWKCDAENTRSLAIAKRLGFQLEAVKRWYRVVPDGSDDRLPGVTDPVKAPGRHYAFLSMCWDTWEREGRETVRKQMARRVGSLVA
jgi:RimJ/RimL family protein N-acetyltransferase